MKIYHNNLIELIRVIRFNSCSLFRVIKCNQNITALKWL